MIECVLVRACQMEPTAANKNWMTVWEGSRSCMCEPDRRWTMLPTLRGAREYHFQGKPGELVRAWVCKKCRKATFMDNAVWEGHPPSEYRHRFPNHNNAIEVNNGIHKICRYLSASHIACKRPPVTSESSCESDSASEEQPGSDCEDEEAGSPRMSLACVGFELELPDKGKGPA